MRRIKMMSPDLNDLWEKLYKRLIQPLENKVGDLEETVKQLEKQVEKLQYNTRTGPYEIR
jgi:hypothetical protein